MSASTADSIESAMRTGHAPLPVGDVFVDRAPRIESGCTISGAGKSATRLNNSAASGVWGDSASLQCWAGREFGIGYCDGFTRSGSSKTTVMLTDPAAAANYPPGSLCWSWPFTQSGVATSRPGQHRVTARTGAALTLDPGPEPDANALCWTADGKRPTGATEGTAALNLYDPVGSAWIGQTVLVSDGQQIANETRGELRIVTNVAGPVVMLDRPLRTRDFVRTAMLVCPVNVCRDITIRDLTLGPGPSGWSCFLKHCRNVRFERVHFQGVAEFSKCAGVTLVDCSADGGLKIGCSQDVAVHGGNWRRINFEEGCTDCLIDGITLTGAGILPGVSTDPYSRCERITLRNSLLRNVVDCPFAIEGRESRVENVVVECGPSSAHCYLWGDRVAMIGVHSDRGLVFKAGAGQVAQRLTAPGIQFGWANEGPSSGTAVGLQSPAVTDLGGRWTVY